MAFKVLLVEDEILVQKSLKRLLEKKGCEVQAFSLGHSAIQALLETDFDRIICDLMLQDISGFDIIEEAKRRYTLQEISNKFVIITAYSSDQVLERAAQYKCTVLSKPFKDINEAMAIFTAGK